MRTMRRPACRRRLLVRLMLTVVLVLLFTTFTLISNVQSAVRRTAAEAATAEAETVAGNQICVFINQMHPPPHPTRPGQLSTKRNCLADRFGRYVTNRTRPFPFNLIQFKFIAEIELVLGAKYELHLRSFFSISDLPKRNRLMTF